LLKISDAAGHRITTAEGLGTAAQPHAVQAAFIAEQAAQCGYCTNGMVMSSVALLRQNPKPSREQAQAALAGNLCRCGSHDRVLKAVERASGQKVA
jgi:nicotinate dehydrogenase subunit A